MKHVYFIGGPWDLVKKSYQDRDVNTGVIYVREIGKAELIVPMADEEDPKMKEGIANFSDHKYYLRRISPHVFIAQHASIF